MCKAVHVASSILHLLHVLVLSFLTKRVLFRFVLWSSGLAALPSPYVVGSSQSQDPYTLGIPLAGQTSSGQWKKKIDS